MDLSFVDALVLPRTRAELPAPAPDTAYLAGGTWLYSQPQPHVRRIVDLAGFGWPALTVTADGLDIAATCTIEQLVTATYPTEWTATPLFRRCADALVASWKIWHTATVGGNLASSLPAGAITAAMCALDGELTIWQPDGGERTEPASTFVTGDGTNTLAPGEIVRSIRIPDAALRAVVAARKIAYSARGRSGALVLGRRGTDGLTLTVSAATVRPHVVHFDRVPSARELADALPARGWLLDPHGTPDWRRHVTGVLAEQVRGQLESGDVQ
ncbi:FAD binding domain-containing protein [Rhodococcus sp. HNM0569]|uniref:FAD binding domain-containing protein n=1 Tax=Rhodococcus sp. HNM0569 TaxID=2716340 RepID=UPI00146ABC7F|nr:FAD binding domain-containing protein [Rhodococcus sp. HNM0569]NLU82156.1 FAD-binding molybdopterin dehydrogenase [Rhodococcus sp. HNM0569]